MGLFLANHFGIKKVPFMHDDERNSFASRYYAG